MRVVRIFRFLAATATATATAAAGAKKQCAVECEWTGRGEGVALN